MSCPFPFREKAAAAHVWYHGFGGSFKGSARSPPMQGWKTGTWQSHRLRAEWNNNIKAQPPCSGGFRVRCALPPARFGNRCDLWVTNVSKGCPLTPFLKGTGTETHTHTHAQALILPWWQGTYTEKPTGTAGCTKNKKWPSMDANHIPGLCRLTHIPAHTTTHTSSTSCLVLIICPPVDLSVRWLNISLNMQMLFFIRGMIECSATGQPDPFLPSTHIHEQDYTKGQAEMCRKTVCYCQGLNCKHIFCHQDILCCQSLALNSTD